MKSLFLATTAVAALLAAPAFAQDAVGSVGASYVNSQADLGPFEAEGDGALVDISVASPAFGEWTVTTAVQASYSDSQVDDEDVGLAGSVHLSRNFAGVRAGAFAAASDAGDATLWTFGGQVQKYFDQATLSGVASYGSTDDVDVWTVGGDVAYYPMANLRLNANLAYNSVEVEDFDVDALTYGAGAEYQFGDSPFTAFGTWDRASVDDFDLDIDTFSIGMRYSFGGSLQTRDRSGADLGRKVGGAAGALAFIDTVSIASPSAE